MRCNVILRICFVFFMLNVEFQLQVFCFDCPKDPNEVLLQALCKNDVQRAFQAISKGADPNLKNTQGYTTLMLAIKENKKEIAVQLCQDPRTDPNMQTRFGRSTLSLAIEEKMTEVALELLKRPEIKIGESLWEAIPPRREMNDVALRLIDDSRTDLNLRHVDLDHTVLMECISSFNFFLAMKLIQNPRVNINFQNEYGITAFRRATSCVNLYEEGITIFTLHRIKDESLNVIRQLIMRGVDPYIRKKKYYKSIKIVNPDPQFRQDMQRLISIAETSWNTCNAAVFFHKAERARLQQLKNEQQVNRSGTFDIAATLKIVSQYL